MDEDRQVVAEFHLAQIANAIVERSTRRVYLSLLYLRDDFTNFRLTDEEIPHLKKAARQIVIRGNLRQFSRISINMGSGVFTVLLVSGSVISHHDGIYVTYEFVGSNEYEQQLKQYLVGIQGGVMKSVVPDPIWKQSLYLISTILVLTIILITMTGSVAVLWNVQGRTQFDTLIAAGLTAFIFLILHALGIWTRHFIQPVHRWIMSWSIPRI